MAYGLATGKKWSSRNPRWLEGKVPRAEALAPTMEGHHSPPRYCGVAGYKPLTPHTSAADPKIPS